ncbi:MAG: phosphoethanolamine transferase [Polaromonas sp. 39-63-25]|uniref:phosphoethanolamine transferase n=1 Tax=unclassified Polaromonas TaxID=2638319 RepID=UPI000BC6E218|nr:MULTISPECIES: phosphoethanolamine--lipid A transferase [unclassified Polaromonas]OYZ13517.1 MAG: phosphoethanolamine transferase [Polaromonas sp. 16-63-31]OYZ75335.1 MAG: phosphoethanolamine transferase [Polaromonas sp. 24-63-21]OZA45324.1 MAG: phosphoethanolamine transferase [Polaromonas sp. 17-63-33]OZA84980.1 MAG: phosphoethanolamine transferase [Polaromonas sp. 39-63-25]
MTKRTFSRLGLSLITSVYMATIANVALWRELSALNLLNSFAGWGLAAALAAAITGCLTGIMSLFAWRWTFKPVIAVLLAMSAAGAYFMWMYHVVVDADMIINVLQTNPAEAIALLNVRMLAALLFLFVIPLAFVIWYPLRWGPVLGQAIRNSTTVLLSLAAVAAVLVASYQPMASAMRNHKQLRYLMNPLNSVYALGRVTAKPFARSSSVLKIVGADAVASPPAVRPPLLLLIVGETARAENFALNGYARSTTPALEREGVVSFRRTSACGTSTAASLPCMFSPLGREKFNSRSHEYENLLDVLQRAGLAVLWLDNQSGCKGVCDRIPYETTRRNDSTLCSSGECLDEVLLNGLEDRLAALPIERRARGTVIVMHQMGSHGPAYYKRSPPSSKRFQPECTSNNLQDCSRAELLNAYDNSIAYTDQFLSSAIQWLKVRQDKFSTAMVYVGDHGESLGENNLYLHGLPYAIAPDVQKIVPWITWLSPAFTELAKLSMPCLRQRSGIPLSHDNLFSSILGLMQVRTSDYASGADAYSACSRAGG